MRLRSRMNKYKEKQNTEKIKFQNEIKKKNFV